MSLFTDKQLIIGVGIVAFIGYAASKKAANALNPLSEENVFHDGVGAVVGDERLDRNLNTIFAYGTLFSPFSSAENRRNAVNFLEVHR